MVHINKKTKNAREEEAAKRTAINRELQRNYREHHGDDLRKARRVATALMTVRRTQGHYYHSLWAQRVKTALVEFLSESELNQLIKELTARRNKKRAK